ncbi:MAG: type II CRISPR-associated endonuclease Cas1 [Rhodospirillales bacterium]|nr:type II CRISPR-associated endonuclease Cas1 [Rhodospirillales bacterium]
MAAWKTIILSQPATVSVRSGAIVIKTDDELLSFSCEDLATIVIENPAVTLTASVLRICGEGGIAILSCDERHLPTTISLPLAGHWKQASITLAQLSCPLRIKNALWMRIVRAKIRNQAAVAQSERGRRIIAAIAARPRWSPDVAEGRAARVYWSTVGDGFRRKPGARADRVNSALDYGYAILLGMVAREIVGAGLVPYVGLHHLGRTNDFNLAADLMEPYRPVVDRVVFEMERGETATLTKADRTRLLKLRSEQAVMDATPHALSECIRLTAVSLREAIASADPSLLVLPAMIHGDHVDPGAV